MHNSINDGPRAKRSLGQNFLRDANIAQKIVGLLNVGPEDNVLEIGPGPGALTGLILERRPARLVLVEKDAHWARERRKAGGGAAQVILGDALAMPWERFCAPWKFIGNLPYNVASPLMWEIVSRSGGLSRAVFMVQKEVALRIAAGPGSGAYGALSVWLQSFIRPELAFVVGPGVFRPAPKVDSAVVVFSPLAQDRFSFEPRALARALRCCFQMRRKQLGTILRKNGKNPEVLTRLGLDQRVRPEELGLEDFHRLSRAAFAEESPLADGRREKAAFK